MISISKISQVPIIERCYVNKFFESPNIESIVNVLSDVVLNFLQPNIRQVAVAALNVWLEQIGPTGLVSFVEAELFSDALKLENPFLRAEVSTNLKLLHMYYLYIPPLEEGIFELITLNCYFLIFIMLLYCIFSIILQEKKMTNMLTLELYLCTIHRNIFFVGRSAFNIHGNWKILEMSWNLKSVMLW